MQIQLEQTWKQALKSQFTMPYFEQLTTFLKTEKALQKTIYPLGSQIFKAFEVTPFNQVKVVILGQDPYHGPGQAHGLSFSVPTGVKPPPSLVNILKELNADVGPCANGQNGNLISWAQQGVLLLNSSLTVRAGEPMSHSKFGWAEFTDAAISALSDQKENIVFLLWGKFAQQKEVYINTGKHYVLRAAHPSPLSAHNGFLGCKHFSKTNQLLLQHNLTPINWKL
jgi:uracil-DNA glycosylase